VTHLYAFAWENVTETYHRNNSRNETPRDRILLLSCFQHANNFIGLENFWRETCIQWSWYFHRNSPRRHE